MATLLTDSCVLSNELLYPLLLLLPALCVYTTYKELTRFWTYVLLYAPEVVATVAAAAVTTIVLGR